MKKFLTLCTLVGSLTISSVASAILVMPEAFFECTATDGNTIALYDANGNFTLSYGDPSKETNRITVSHKMANYTHRIQNMLQYQH